MTPDRARVAVLISGAGTNMAALLYASRAPDCPYAIAMVASDVPEAAGLALARAEGVTVATLPAWKPRATFLDALDAALQAHAIAVVALAGFMRILPPEFVARWAGRIVNIHPSLLPAYPGLDTHARALADGAQEAGCTVHLVDAGVDTGPVLARARVAVIPGDTAATLGDRVRIAEHQLYPRALSAFVREARR